METSFLVGRRARSQLSSPEPPFLHRSFVALDRYTAAFLGRPMALHSEEYEFLYSVSSSADRLP
jgi:hypothetical protein